MEWGIEMELSWFWMWYFKGLGGRSAKLPFTDRRPSEHQAPHYFCGECLMAGMVWEGGGGFYTEHLCTRSSNVFNLRKKRFHPLRKHFLGFQSFYRKGDGSGEGGEKGRGGKKEEKGREGAKEERKEKEGGEMGETAVWSWRGFDSKRQSWIGLLNGWIRLLNKH